jgi:photosystem II stability/assembly factor-like uncharacterized protein
MIKKSSLFFTFLLTSKTILFAQWQQTSCPFTSTQFFYSLASNGSNIYAGRDAPGNIFLSNDNGANWSVVNNGLAGAAVNSLVIKDTNVFAADWMGGVFLSTNNGTNWTALNNGLINTMVSSFLISDSNIFVGYNGGVCLSSNNGSSWTSVNSGLPNTAVRAFTKSGSNIFAGTAGYGVYVSSNNGSNWTAVNNGLMNGNVYSLASLGTKIFAGTQGGCFLTNDSGLNWTQVINLSVRSFAVYGSNIFAGIESGYVYLSTDSGANWNSISNGLNGASIYSLSVSDSNIFAGTWGSGVWKRSLSEVVGIKEIINYYYYYNLSIYPNPASDNCNLIVPDDFLYEKNLTLIIYDNSGKLIQQKTLEMNDDKMNNGKIKLNLEAEAKGVYSVTLSNGKKSYNGKIVFE